MSATDTSVAYVDATLRDLAPLPWGGTVGTDDLAAVAGSLADVGASVVEALDPRCARAAVETRRESPWDRLRAIVREVGTTPVGIVLIARTLWGEEPVAADVARRFVLCAVESGARRVRVADALNDVAAIESLARATAEAGAVFVPTLTIGPSPGSGDARWVAEAEALAALPGAAALCISDPGGFLAPDMLGGMIKAVSASIAVPVEVQVQAPGGLAPLAATAAVHAGAAAVHASAGPVAMLAARPSAETLRAALEGSPRRLACDADAVDHAGRVVGPMLAADRLRQAAAAVFGPALAIPPHLEAALVSRLGRLGLSRTLHQAADEAALVAAEVGGATFASPLGLPIVAQAARHVIEGERWAEIEPVLAAVALGRLGPLRVTPSDEVVSAAREAEPPESPLRDLAAVADAAPAGLSDEDSVLWAQFGEAVEPLVARRRSLGAEAGAEVESHGIDRQLLDTLVEVVESTQRAEVSVEVAGARVTVRRVDPAAAAAPGEPGRAGGGRDAAAADSGLERIESPMVGTFYRASSPESAPFVEIGQRIEPGEAVCLIEAMKLFNEIVCETGGTVREILVENAEPVEFGQPLFLIEP